MLMPFMTVQRVSQKTASLRFTNTFKALQGLGGAEKKIPMILCNAILLVRTDLAKPRIVPQRTENAQLQCARIPTRTVMA